MDNNSLRKPSPPKSITHIENEHFALWLSSHEPDLRCQAIQHSIFDVLQDMGITKNAILKAALTQISLCCKVDIKCVAPTTKNVHRPKIHCSEKLLHLKKNLHSDKECNTKTKIFDKYRQIIKNKFEKCKFQSKSNNSVNGSQISPDIGELTDEEKIKLLFVEGNIDNDCVITKDPLSVNKAENTTTVVLKRKAKCILNNIEMGAPVEKHKRGSESHDKLKQPQNNIFLDSSENSSHSYHINQENKTNLGIYATCNKRDDEVIKYTKNCESPSKNIEMKKSVSTKSTNNYPSKQTAELKQEDNFILTKSTKHYPSKRTTKSKELENVKNVEGSNIGKIRVRDITTLMASSEPIKETSVLPLDVSNKTNKTFLEFKKTSFLSNPKIPKYILQSFGRNDIRFMKLYTLKFNELVDSKIEIMGGLLHMGITDLLCKQNRLKWADKLLSEKSIYIEKQRIERECRDAMRQRGIEFSALLGSIVNKFEDDCVIDMFFALYARLVETLLKIDVENEKHLFLSKHIIYDMLLKNNYTNKIVMGLFQINNEVFKQSFSKFNSLIKFCNSFYTTEDGNVHKFNPNELECQQLTEGIFLNESKTLPVINNCFIIQEGQKNVNNNLCMVKEATCSITTNTPQENDLFNNSSNKDSEVKDTSVPTVNQLEDCSGKVTDCSENDLNLKVTEVVSIKNSTKLDHAYADKIQWINNISDNSEKENNVHNFKIPEEIETIDITDNEEVNTDQNCQSIAISEGERNSTHDSVSSAKVRNVGVVYPMGNNMLQTNTSNVVSSTGNTKVCATEQTNKINLPTLKKVIIKKAGIKQVGPVFPKVIKLAPINYNLSPRFYKVHVPNRDGLESNNVPQTLSFRKVSPYLDQTDKQSDTIVLPTITKSQLMGLQTNRKIILTDKAIQNDAQTIPSLPFMHLSNDEARKFFYFANNASSSNVNNTDLSSTQTPEVVIVYNNGNSPE